MKRATADGDVAALGRIAPSDVLREAVAEQLSQALRAKDEGRFNAVAFVYRHEIIAALSTSTETPSTQGRDVAAHSLARDMAEIRSYAKMANDVIRLGRAETGGGRVKVATCLHHIERLANKAPAALTQPAPEEMREPFGYWIEQKGAEPALLRKPAYIPEPSELRTVTPLYLAVTPSPTGDARREQIARARDALERIAKPGVGAGPDWSDRECADYWLRQTQHVRSIAKDALAILALVSPPNGDSGLREAVIEECAAKLRAHAAELRTPAGRHKAEWCEPDADMVANEIDRQASSLRLLKAKQPGEA